MTRLFPVHHTGFSIYIFPGFFAIFILLSSNNNKIWNFISKEKDGLIEEANIAHAIKAPKHRSLSHNKKDISDHKLLHKLS